MRKGRVYARARGNASKKINGALGGCVRGFWQSVEEMVPVGSPGVAVEGATERRHPIRPPHAPPRPCLLHASADHLLARPLHQAAADRLPPRQPLGVTQVLGPSLEVTGRVVQRRLLRRRPRRRSGRREMRLHSRRPRRQQRLAARAHPGLGRRRPFAVQHLGAVRQVFRPVVDVQQPLGSRQLLVALIPDPLGAIPQHRDVRGLLDSQPAGPAADAGPEMLGGLDPPEQHPRVRRGQPPRVPRRGRRRTAPLPFGEDAQAHLAPALPGIDHRAVGLELDVAGGGREAGPGRGARVQPVGQQPGLLVADGADSLVTSVQAAELSQVGGGTGERPTGAGQGEEFTGVRADEASDAQAVVEGIAAGVAAGTDEVESFEANGARGGQDVSPGVPLVPEAASAATGAARRPFFSAASAWAWRVAWTAWRASSRAAGTARASTRARTWPSGAASAVVSSCRASSRACSTKRAWSGVSAWKVVRWVMAVPQGLGYRQDTVSWREQPETIGLTHTVVVGYSAW